MNSKIVKNEPDFNYTIKVKAYNYEDIMNQERLQKMIGNDESVEVNIVKTITTTIFDTMTNANNLF